MIDVLIILLLFDTYILTGRFAISKLICACFVQLSTAVRKHEL